MNWTEISIKVASVDVDRVAAIANMSVPYGIYIEDYSDLIEQSWEIAHVDLIEQELLKKDRNSAVIHIYISEEDNAVEAVEYIKELLFVAEHYLGHPLNATEMNAILYWKEALNFSGDLIDYLIESCVAKGHKSVHYMEKVALSWAKAGITTVSAAKEEANAEKHVVVATAHPRQQTRFFLDLHNLHNISPSL